MPGIQDVDAFSYHLPHHSHILDHASHAFTISRPKPVQKKFAERFRCASVSDFCTAADMLRFGYHHSIIPEQTSLSAKQAKLLWEKFRLETPDCIAQPSSSRNPASLPIKNKNTKIHTSILMQAYRICGQDIMHAVDIQALNKAWMIYKKTVRQANGADSKCVQININQAWGLAKMLTDGRGCFEYCDHCQCWFFTSIEQQTTLHCPFCKD